MSDEEAAAYDPGDHTVEEVKEYVEEHPDESAAIAEAEKSGKARTTLLDALESDEEEPPEIHPVDPSTFRSP